MTELSRRVMLLAVTGVLSAAGAIGFVGAGAAGAGAAAPTHLQAVYAVPSDASPVAGRTDAISDTVIAVQGWFGEQTGGRYPLFVRDEAAIIVPTVTLTQTTAQLAAMSVNDADTSMKAQIEAQVADSSGTELLVFVQGEVGGACGYTSGLLVVVPIENCSIEPRSPATFPYGATYLVAHELTHRLGAVPSCAPNHVPGGHVGDDRRDILYQGSEPRDWDNLMLDPGGDDYFQHGRPGCTDVAASPLLGTWASSCPLVPTPFTDVASSFAADDISCIYGLGVTTGTGPTTYDPNGLLTHEQMASFLARLYRTVNGTDAPLVPTPFTDVASSFAADDISRIYGLGVTTGTGPTTYDPNGLLTREQMASFLARLHRTVNGTDAPLVPTPFTDVASSFAADDISRIYGLGVTTGTGPTTYDPNGLLTHEQMASFLARLHRVLQD